MTELADVFAELGISHYLHDFLEQGFDTWETILDITESDFDALGVKLGHRRKLQRKIANSRGFSSDRALASPRNTPTDDRQPDELKAGNIKAESKDGSGISHGAKRKYRRHPKPDENAPERPPSAYVIFSNKMREELKGRNLSFTEIAKLVGENWQNLSPAEKEPYEQQAFSAKEKYNNELTEYKKTENYKEYSQYLAEFKARHSTTQQANDSDAAKRPKLEAHASAVSSGSSATSQHGGDTPIGRMRVESSASMTGQWHPSEGQTSPQLSNMPKLSVALGGPKPQVSPSAPSPTVLPGYRDSLYGSHQQLHPWREGQRDDTLTNHQQLPRLSSVTDGRSTLSGTQAADPRNLTGSQQHAHRSAQAQSHPPPLLTSESTNRSTTSSASTGSSAFFTPRTPLEPPLERSLPIPSLYSQKSYENQLPPLRPPSLSPQSTLVTTQQSPNPIHAIVDLQPSIPPIRGYGSAQPQGALTTRPDPRLREYISNSVDDNNLDPVSALLRAGEIVDRGDRNNGGPPGP
ncbi:uncharacterized protein LY89DRAFT_294738 [Mollisia scopiformis]|uniref:HMG box domain-containing protein n=1 Tax=Mollisia scopiformis TaxID=149040 RepID=A0A194XRK2_MOLSC|nr:uncharacterized protein LY89DRAFT_294738 [Mollisia scopiformis]KUJ22357.1 hypothetical protein LY89DRAFT_294738 [Mollisia scopiformis]